MVDYFEPGGVWFVLPLVFGLPMAYLELLRVAELIPYVYY
jgi:hypothetical protein